MKDRINSDLWEALGRYVMGESSSLEAERVSRWLAEGEGREELVAALRRSIASVEFTSPPGLDVEAALRRVTARLEEPEVISLESRKTAPRSPRMRTMGLRAAAAVALVVGATILWRISDNNTPDGTAARSYATAVGHTDSIHLPDGSLAVLAPASRLDVAGDFGGRARTVEL